MREMVRVCLYENGDYKVENIGSNYATQKLYGSDSKGSYKMYHCLKNKWKVYLLKLIDTKKIDKEIAKLKKRKQQMEMLRKKLEKELMDITCEWCDEADDLYDCKEGR